MYRYIGRRDHQGERQPQPARRLQQMALAHAGQAHDPGHLQPAACSGGSQGGEAVLPGITTMTIVSSSVRIIHIISSSNVLLLLLLWFFLLLLLLYVL